MVQILQYDKNVLLNRISSQYGFSLERAKSIALSIDGAYSSARTYTKTDKEAADMIIKGSKAAFGFEINQGILETALKYVGKFEGNIASEEFINNAREQRNQPRALEAEVERTYSGNGNVVPISSGRQAQTVYRTSFRRQAARIAASIAFGGMVLGYGSAYSRAQAPPAAPTAAVSAQNQPLGQVQPVNPQDYQKHLQDYEMLRQQVQSLSGRVDSLEQKVSQGGGSSVAQAASAQPASQTQVRAPATPAGTSSAAPSSAQTPAQPSTAAPASGQAAATTPSSQQNLAQIVQGTPQHLYYDVDGNQIEKPVYRNVQTPNERDAFLCDKGRGKDTSKYPQSIWRWFGLFRGTKSKPLEVKYEQQGNDYYATVTPQVSKRINNLSDHRVEVTFALGDSTITYTLLQPNVANRLKVSKEYFDAQAGITVQRLYTSNDGKTFDVYASTNSTKPINYEPDCEKLTPAPKPAPTPEKVAEPPKVEPPKHKVEDVGGIPFHPDHLTTRPR